MPSCNSLHSFSLFCSCSLDWPISDCTVVTAVCRLHNQVMWCQFMKLYLSSCCGLGAELNWSWRVLIWDSSLAKEHYNSRINNTLLSYFSILSGLGAAARSNSSCLIFASRLTSDCNMCKLSWPTEFLTPPLLQLSVLVVTHSPIAGSDYCSCEVNDTVKYRWPTRS